MTHFCVLTDERKNLNRSTERNRIRSGGIVLAQELRRSCTPLQKSDSNPHHVFAGINITLPQHRATVTMKDAVVRDIICCRQLVQTAIHTRVTYL